MEVLDESNYEGGLPQSAIDDMRKTAPWMKFIAILNFVFAGFAVLGVFGMLALVFMAPGGMAGVFAILILVYIALIVVQVVLGINLMQSAIGFEKYAKNGSSEDIAKAFQKQKTFWMTAGIVAIVFISLYLLFIIFAAGMGDGFGELMRELR